LIEVHEEDYSPGTSLKLLLCTFPGLERVVISSGRRSSLVVVKARGEVRETAPDAVPAEGVSSFGSALSSPKGEVVERDKTGSATRRDSKGTESSGKGGANVLTRHFSRK
jgi:hypothetical protein